MMNYLLDRMVLWPGMGTDNGQLVQSIVSSSTETATYV